MLGSNATSLHWGSGKQESWAGQHSGSFYQGLSLWEEAEGQGGQEGWAPSSSMSNCTGLKALGVDRTKSSRKVSEKVPRVLGPLPASRA